MFQSPMLRGAAFFVSGLAIIAATALTLFWMGQEPICKCGYVNLWDGGIVSAENSQHFTDWYTPSHFIHGILFYGVLAWLLGSLSFGARLNIALLMEASWEIFENSDFIINRYREATIALDYFGDSVLNSTSDLLFMVLGFLMAWRVPIWVSIFVVIALEVIVGYFIRDNLILNVVMLVYPMDFIKDWQLAR
ncbi:MAG: DUF2585 domain-containing protein [Hyphomicrobiaceae bacterium]|nr:DUF2585 domain-containing protein [Hyphomicrobiaceae bacterium]